MKCLPVIFFSQQYGVLRLYVTLSGFIISHLILKNEEVNLYMPFRRSKKEANWKKFQQKPLIVFSTIVRSLASRSSGGQQIISSK